MKSTEKRVRAVEEKLGADDYKPIVVTVDPSLPETRREVTVDSRGSDPNHHRWGRRERAVITITCGDAGALLLIHP